MADEFMEELKAAAFEVLLTNTGMDEGDWAQTLIEGYPAEVVDALGTIPEEVYASLADLWEDVYYDKASDMEKTFQEWADTFCNEQTVDLYHRLIEARKE